MSDTLKWYEPRNAFRTPEKLYPFTTPLDLLRFSAVSLRSRIALGLLVLKARRIRDWAPLEEIAAREWILRTAGNELLGRLGADGLLCTRGEKGMVLFEDNGAIHDIPVSDKSEVYDVSGAGDTCVAAVILALAAGVSPAQAAELSNIASGIAVRKLGTATVSAEELGAILDK